VAYDIEAYSGHGTRRELAARGQLANLLDYVFHEAGIPSDSHQVQMQGDHRPGLAAYVRWQIKK
jgi:hypothetical protein